MGADGDKKVFLQIRVGKGLKRDFEKACKQNDLTASQVLRAHMREYVNQYPGELEAEEEPQGKAKAEVKPKGGKK
jgi:antitoxin component of RelBE/YafQ-DinJ toxin-antitoxin module